jgi:small basic protein
MALSVLMSQDEEGLLRLLRRWQDEATRAGRRINRIAVAFEAGRDGFWLARWFQRQSTAAYRRTRETVAALIVHFTETFGGIRAVMEGIFDDKVFVVSFVANVLIAALIVFLGDQLGVGAQLSTAVIVVLGIRIFTNVASIRRLVFRA